MSLSRAFAVDGWTIATSMAGGQSPRIRISVQGARSVAERDNCISIDDPSGKMHYRYADLKAWDATHHELPAKMRLARPGLIEIAVNDAGARYPITIDPTLTFIPTLTTA